MVRPLSPDQWPAATDDERADGWRERRFDRRHPHRAFGRRAGDRSQPAYNAEALADLLMDLRMDGPAADGATYQDTMRHYAHIILARMEEA